MDEDLAALSWTLRDEADQPWFEVLLITSAEVGLWVRPWMGGWCRSTDICFPGGSRAGAGFQQVQLSPERSTSETAIGPDETRLSGSAIQAFTGHLTMVQSDQSNSHHRLRTTR